MASPSSPRRPLTAVGRFIGAVHAVVVTVTDPDTGDAALGDGTLELVGGTGHLRCRREEGCQEGQQGRQGPATPCPKNQPWGWEVCGCSRDHKGLVCSAAGMEQSHQVAPEDSSQLWGDRADATRSLSWATGSAQIHFKGFKDFIST